MWPRCGQGGPAAVLLLLLLGPWTPPAAASRLPGPSPDASGHAPRGAGALLPAGLGGHHDPAVRRAARRLQSALQVLQGAGEGDEAQAAKEAAAHLDEAEAALERVRGDAADAQRPPRASSSFLARSSLLDGEGGAEGPPGESGDLAAGSAGPAAASASAGIGLNGSVAGWFGPDPQDLEQVAQWASWLSGGGARGAAAAATVRESPGDAAQTLRFLAEDARRAADGVDRDQQALLHLVEMQLERRGRSEVQSTRSVVRQLADDFRRLRELEGMGAEALSALPAQDLLTRYFRGVATSPAARSREQEPAGASGAPAPAAASLSRVLVVSCSYGDGHRSAAEAVASYLQTSPAISAEVLDTTTDLRMQVDQALLVPNASTFYSLMLRGHWHRLYNTVDALRLKVFGQLRGPCPAPSCDNKWKHRFRGVVLDSRPDAIVTVYHMDLLPILEVAKDLGNLPVLHIATDMDVKMREVFGSGPAPVYPRFLVGVPFDTTTSYDTISPLTKNLTVLSGYPVRPSFLEASNASSLLAASLGPPGAKLVLVMTGGEGQDSPWAEALASGGVGLPLHVMVVAGRNSAMEERLEGALRPAVLPDGRRVLRGADANVTVEVVRDPAAAREDGSRAFYVGAPHLKRLMDSADAIITKPGGGTTSEAAYCGLPALFDASGGMLHWEELTSLAFERAGAGVRFSGVGELPAALRRVLGRPRSRQLAEDPLHPGAVLQTGERVRAALHRLAAAPCRQCALFPPASESWIR